jgi:hypothetical protein
LAAVGTPLGVLAAGGFGAGLAGLVAGLLAGLDAFPLPWPGLADFFVFGLAPLGVVDVFGVVVVGVLRDGVVPDVVVVDVVVVDVDGVVVIGVVVVGVVMPAVGHDSVTFCAGPGRCSDDTGWPGGSWKVSTWPVRSVTVTVQSAAEALGSAAMADTARAVPADASATLSFRCLNTVALSPPEVPSAATIRIPSDRRNDKPSY